MKEIKEKYKNEMSEVLQDYKDNSTVAGLRYAFASNQSKACNGVWSLAVFSLAVLGIFTSVQIYNDWKDEPVVTLVESTGIQISEIPFPSVVICSRGSDPEGYGAAFYKLLYEFVNTTIQKDMKFPPIRYYRINQSLPLKKVTLFIVILILINIQLQGSIHKYYFQ